jgi:endoglucanase
MIRVVFVVLWLGVWAGIAAGQAKRGDVVFRETFDAALDRWQGVDADRAKIEDGRLRMTLAGRGDYMISVPLPIEQIRGARVTIGADVAAENVVRPAELWNGIKLMLITESPGGTKYDGPSELHGTFAARSVGRTAVVPADATSAKLVLGFQDSGGTVSFDNVTVTVTGVPRSRPATRPALSPDRRTDVPRFRGVMYGPHGKEEDLRTLAGWGGNAVRWQFYSYKLNLPEHRGDLAAYDAFIDETIKEVDRFLPLCEQLGIGVVIDLHTPPGAGGTAGWVLFQEKAAQDKFLAVWDKLAQHYKDQRAVWGYDLVNEPVEGQIGPGCDDWRTLAEKAARRVRAIDPKKAIFVAPGPSGGWEDLPFFEPLDVPGVIYTVHVYDPIRFTHQGVLDGMPAGVTYPGTVDGKRWDRAELERILQPVRDYQFDYNVPVYVGEFSAPRWAPPGSAGAYLGDVISVCEQYGWDWTYHAFREWHGWDVEVPSRDPKQTKRTGEANERMTVLREALGRNRDDAK